MKLWMIGVLMLFTLLLVGSASAVIHVDSANGPQLMEKLLDVDGTGNYTDRMRTREDIVYRPNEDVEVILRRGGRITIFVEEGEFVEAIFEAKVQVKIDIEGSILKLKGRVDGKINEDYTVDFTGPLKVKRDFDYQPNDRFKTTLLKGSSVTVVVERSEFKYAILDLKVLAEIEIKGQWLKLEGTVSGKIDAAFKVDLTGELSIAENFTYTRSRNIKLILLEGGQVSIVIEQSKFKEAELNLTAIIELPYGNKVLRLKGLATGRINDRFRITLNGRLTQMSLSRSDSRSTIWSWAMRSWRGPHSLGRCSWSKP